MSGAAIAQPPAPTPEMLAQQAKTRADRQQMMDQLHIDKLRDGANGSNPQAPNYANYDESKANPWPNLPDPHAQQRQKGHHSGHVVESAPP
jgi:hypothetical protein